VERQLDIRTRQVAEREICSEYWLYTKGDLLRENFFSDIGYT